MLIFLYDEAGSPVGFQYRNSTYASDQFDTYWYRKNLQGDVMAIYDADGTTIAWYAYDAFGKQTYGAWRTHASNLYKNIYNINPYRYRSYYYDTETSLYYLNSRYYDPNTCRFINADGYTSTGQGVLGNNMYAYCANNPVMYVDPQGDLCFSTFLVITLLTCLIAAPAVIIFAPELSNIEDISVSGELYDSDRKNPNDDHPFNERAFWYDVEGGSTNANSTGYIDASCGFDKGGYYWDYFEMEAGIGRFNGSASANIKNGVGASLEAETMYGSATVIIPIFGHKLKLGVKGNLGSIGVNAKIGAETEIGIAFGIGGSVFFEWD